jgi:hypothetical protein
MAAENVAVSAAEDVAVGAERPTGWGACGGWPVVGASRPGSTAAPGSGSATTAPASSRAHAVMYRLCRSNPTQITGVSVRGTSGKAPPATRLRETLLTRRWAAPRFYMVWLGNAAEFASHCSYSNCAQA